MIAAVTSSDFVGNGFEVEPGLVASRWEIRRRSSRFGLAPPHSGLLEDARSRSKNLGGGSKKLRADIRILGRIQGFQAGSKDLRSRSKKLRGGAKKLRTDLKFLDRVKGPWP